jgi:hypothetical protein
LRFIYHSLAEVGGDYHTTTVRDGTVLGYRVMIEIVAWPIGR